MNIEFRLQDSIARWNLLESRFYQAWSEGRLPLRSLRQYSCEYGAFIALIPKAWESHGDFATAAVERQHVELWQRFAASLGTAIGEPETSVLKALIATAKRLFDDPVSSVGALYAFEAQQPSTARTKLMGLREHYDLPESAETYFDVHSTDDTEPALLLERMAEFSANDQIKAAQACEEMSRSLRTALDALTPAESMIPQRSPQ